MRKPPVQVAAELRLALDFLDTDRPEYNQLVAVRNAGNAAIKAIADMIREFQAEVQKELATGGYWPMDTAPTEEGARILGLVQRGQAYGLVVEPRVLIRKSGLWQSVPGGWTALAIGWRPVPAEDIVDEGRRL